MFKRLLCFLTWHTWHGQVDIETKRKWANCLDCGKHKEMGISTTDFSHVTIYKL